MRDYRDAKAMARDLRRMLAAKGVKLSQAEALEFIARLLGARDWNTLAAAIQTRLEPDAPTPPPQPTPAPPKPPDPRQRFAPALEATLHRAVGLAAQRKHEYTTVEHLLMALIDDPDALAVLEACAVDVPALGWALLRHIDVELTSLVREGGTEQRPTAGFQRVIQRAVIHVQSSGRDQVTGANILVAIFSERESKAYHLLTAQHMNRYDAVNFIAHGVRRDGGKAG